ncbi:hypothetical protein EJ05DRAFT_185488 [Pseudovirgaria hyperparasitica]|uniref:ATP-dependent RNA helicase DHX8 n=1 Tax=Pseudovirgaria hyperparasitica TaxID=470096 RepID=A0A6A6WGA1_9PEZI|nr:uncharacterized protein EJ05DRAFT_185488 [Pseudovirgaria hyperparasitica]KAF2761803.1 hypothetical protein EJ05DRAFT_185488 [Pseudovirgaria hyperparasitica]
MPPQNPPQQSPPQRQIRAHTPSNTTITLYQAYPSTIATPAVQAQRLSASPSFSLSRMTWIKPSWAWMLYRAGYSYKDPGQERILALTMQREYLWGMLRTARLSTHSAAGAVDKGEAGSEVEGGKKGGVVVVQWDPERDVWLRRLGWRSVQIGVPRGMSGTWAEEGILEIEDVTDRARELKRVIDEGNVTIEALVEKGLVPKEEVIDVPEDIRKILAMD